ncbi:MAG: hypothetical protein SaCV1_gp2 [Sanya chuvirus 1]|nr:MAG: hypothetical protein SaCV1_gp2 [Sanya chuvirus 1]
MKVYIPVLVVLAALTADALIGYDCRHPEVKITAISLTELDDCPDYPDPDIEEAWRLQLIQKRRFARRPYIQCEVIRKVFRFQCGNMNHLYRVTNGYQEFYDTLTMGDCEKMINTERYTLASRSEAIRLKINSTVSGSINTVGWTHENGYCGGESVTLDGLHYDRLVETTHYTITLYRGYSTVDYENGLMILPSGVKCPLESGKCMDLTKGMVFWDNVNIQECSADSYIVLYEGAGKVLTSSQDKRQVLVVDDSTSSFSLEVRDPVIICNVASFKTEHPQLLISRATGRVYNFRNSGIDPLDVSLSAFINSKFVYVERHIRSQLNSLYRDVLKYRCLIHRNTLVNLLSLAMISDEEFAYAYSKKPGYSAIRKGEVVYLIECVPVYVVRRDTTLCYNDLPVVHMNKSMFLSARSWILGSYGEEVDCTDIMPVQFNLEGEWYKINPSLHQAIKPQVLSPYKEKTWTYVVPKKLAEDGLYSSDLLQKWQDQAILPSQQETVSRIMAKQFIGLNVHSQGGSMHNLIDEDTLKKVTMSFLDMTWGIFSSFGRIASGVIGFVIIIKAVKWMVDAIMNGVALYKVYGFSIAIAGCVWDNIAHLLISFKKPKPHEEESKEETSTLVGPTAPDDGTELRRLDQAGKLKPATYSELTSKLASMQGHANV